jgi:hypothetical protein
MIQSSCVCVESVSRNALESESAHSTWSDFDGNCLRITWRRSPRRARWIILRWIIWSRDRWFSWRSGGRLGGCSFWVFVWSVCLLPSLFSEFQLLLRPALLIPDDGFNADDGHGSKHEYGSKHEHGSKLLSVPDELLSIPDAVVPTLNVRILVDSPVPGVPSYSERPAHFAFFSRVDPTLGIFRVSWQV